MVNVGPYVSLRAVPALPISIHRYSEAPGSQFVARTRQVVDQPEYHVELEALITRCLDKDPNRRFHSARDLALLLRELRAQPESSFIRSRWRWTPRLVVAATSILIAALIGVGWFESRARVASTAADSPIRSIAVLPLANLSGDADQEYFADAMTEELTMRLAKVGAWRVTSRTSVMGYRSTRKKVAEIARELGVDAVIEGSVVCDGSRVKVTAQLIDGQTDEHLWAESYERQMEDVLAIQSDIARAIARELGLTLTADGATGLISATRPVLPAAYDAYVRGRQAWDKRGEADLRDAIRLFQQSIDADPTYSSGDRYASSYAIAVVHAGMGDRERALSLLGAALRERSHWLVWLKRDPRWNDIRPDARFKTSYERSVCLPEPPPLGVGV